MKKPQPLKKPPTKPGRYWCEIGDDYGQWVNLFEIDLPEDPEAWEERCDQLMASNTNANEDYPIQWVKHWMDIGWRIYKEKP